MRTRDMNRWDRIALAESYWEKGRIIQRAWRGVDNRGRNTVCALAAFGRDINDPNDCPADLMPDWLARYVPSLDDGIAEADVPMFAGGIIARAKLWHTLDQEAWERIGTIFARCWDASPRDDYPDYMILVKRLFGLLDEELEKVVATATPEA